MTVSKITVATYLQCVCKYKRVMLIIHKDIDTYHGDVVIIGVDEGGGAHFRGKTSHEAYDDEDRAYVKFIWNYKKSRSINPQTSDTN